MRTVVLSLFIAVVGCAPAPTKPAAAPAAESATDGEPPAPKGVERSLVLVDETAPAPPKKPVADDALTTRRIVERVMSDLVSPTPASTLNR